MIYHLYVSQMRLVKIVDDIVLQVYAITAASKEFKEQHDKSYIVVHCNDFNDVDVRDTNKLMPADVTSYNGCTYIFTYKRSIPRDLRKLIDRPLTSVDMRYNPGSAPRCLDRHFINSKHKVNVIFNVYPRFNIVPRQFDSPIVIKANDKKLQFDALGKQLADIINKTIKAKPRNTVEEWLKQFIEKPFTTASLTCVRYPSEIDDSTKGPHIKPYDLFVEYDIRADTYTKENDLYSVIGEAFEQKNAKVTIYDTYDGLLDKVTKALDAKKLSYKRNNQYSITTQYKYIKELNLSYTLLDFL